MREPFIDALRNGPSVSDAVALGPGLAVQGTRLRFRRNEEIFGEGEHADYVYRVVSGAVRTVRFSSDGRRQILGFHFPGDVFGLDAGARYTLTAEAVADADVALVRRSVIDALAVNDAGAAHALFKLMQLHLGNAREHVLLLGRRGASERVAAFLLKLTDRYSATSAIDLPMSRADIADYLALTIETVSRAFTQMERDNAIHLESARHVIVRDRCALELLEAA